MFDAGVSEITSQRGKVKGLRAGDVEIHTPVIVNAAGGWAQEIGELAGASPMPLRLTRRHLFLTDILEWVKPDWPFIWDLTGEVYFRPDAEGLMLSPCDEMDPGPSLDSDEVLDEVESMLLEKVALEEIMSFSSTANDGPLIFKMNVRTVSQRSPLRHRLPSIFDCGLNRM